MIYRNI